MTYSIPSGNDSLRIRFNRELFQYKIQSHSGKYSQKSQGILREYEKIIKSVIIFDKKYLSNVKEIVIKYDIIARYFEVKEI